MTEGQFVFVITHTKACIDKCSAPLTCPLSPPSFVFQLAQSVILKEMQKLHQTQAANSSSLFAISVAE
ncbi:unnamed protein product, partial [Dibothriocephalus latus]